MDQSHKDGKHMSQNGEIRLQHDEPLKQNDTNLNHNAVKDGVTAMAHQLESPFSSSNSLENDTIQKLGTSAINANDEKGCDILAKESKTGPTLDPRQFISPLQRVRPTIAARFLFKSHNLQKTDVASFVLHQKNIYNVELKGLPKPGSFVEYNTSHIPGSQVGCGIVLNDQKSRLTAAQIYYILTPDGRIDRIAPPQIGFIIRDFVCCEKIEQLTDSELQKLSSCQSVFYTRQVSSPSTLLYFAKLAYVINSLIAFTEKLRNVMASRKLDEAAITRFGQTQKQCSISVHRFGSYLLKDDTMKYIISPLTNTLGVPALLYTIHLVMYEDPVHFRVNSHNSAMETNPKALLNPLEQIDSHYFINPMNLMPVLSQIDQARAEELEKKYKRILIKRLKYRIFVLLGEDLCFFNLIRFMKYTLEYPHKRFLCKLSFLNEHPSVSDHLGIAPAYLYRLLVEIGIYNRTTNPVLSSGIYGELKQSLVPSMRCSSLSQLMPYIQVDRVAIYDKSEDKELQIAVPYNSKVKVRVSEVEAMLRKGALSLNNANSSNVLVSNAAGIEFPAVIYRIDYNLGLSVRKLSMTQYEFSFFMPVPRKSIKRWMISNPISFPRLSDYEFQDSLVDLYDQIPKDKNYKNSSRKPILSFKISFLFDYLKSESLTDPEIKVTLDSFRHTQMLERIDSSKESDKRNITRLATKDKLDNLLKQKEHARLQQGLLKLDRECENIGFLPPMASQSGFSSHVVLETRHMLDEFLSMYCEKNHIPVISRSVDVNQSESTDFRRSRKFRIFKWYANSYNSFRQGASVDLSSFVSSLKYLEPMKIGIHPKSKMAPLGLSHYASFTASDYLESYVNRVQLLRHVTHDEMLDMRRLQPKIQSNSDAFLDFRHRLRQYVILSGLKRSIETQFGRMRLFRCVVVGPPYTTLIGGIKKTMNTVAYCIDLNLMAEIDLTEKGISKNLMVGDRLICTKVVEIDPVGVRLVLR